ncbi:hypothetical protein O7614_03580 [Micromonospora sp. WMMD961]|uniref:hypothetical protein n=1 Tax=Micromonospora sp. WMMD961 TaxID=3016100 RepID=UPI0024179832|nr:hypothetical protein [Micromonospora sp. WMMD961]MDG4778725.1 hypothetical protein [Micromonospora sp. WMMD961]
MKPEAVVAGGVPYEVLLARTPDAAVAVTGLLALPAGLEFTLTAVLRRERVGRPFDPGPPHGMRRFGAGPLPDELLRFGVQFSDGLVATNLARPPLAQMPEPATPVLLHQGGSGTNRRNDMRYWIWPLPPPGPLTFVCEWPTFKIPESRVTVDAQPIIDAANRAVELWPDDESSG